MTCDVVIPDAEGCAYRVFIFNHCEGPYPMGQNRCPMYIDFHNPRVKQEKERSQIRKGIQGQGSGKTAATGECSDECGVAGSPHLNGYTGVLAAARERAHRGAGCPMQAIIAKAAMDEAAMDEAAMDEAAMDEASRNAWCREKGIYPLVLIFFAMYISRGRTLSGPQVLRLPIGYSKIDR